MAYLNLPPDNSEYSFGGDGFEYRRAALDGAAGFYSRGKEGPKLFNCTWVLDANDFINWRDFFNARKADMLAFDVMLISHKGFPENHTAKFEFNSYSLTRQSGDAFVVSCQLKAFPNNRPLPEENWMITEDDIDIITEDGYLQMLEN